MAGTRDDQPDEAGAEARLRSARRQHIDRHLARLAYYLARPRRTPLVLGYIRHHAAAAATLLGEHLGPDR